MRKLITTLLAFIALVALIPPIFADDLIHDVFDHTIGYGHHNRYYTYDYGYSGYAAYPGYYGYGRPFYSNTHTVFAGSHYRHRSTGMRNFGIRRGHGRDRH